MDGGWSVYVPGDDGNRKLLIDTMEAEGREPEVVRRKDIPNYFSDENRKIISRYWTIQKYGLPYHGGPMEQPCIAMDIITALDNEMSVIRRNKDGR